MSYLFAMRVPVWDGNTFIRNDYYLRHVEGYDEPVTRERYLAFIEGRAPAQPKPTHPHQDLPKLWDIPGPHR